MPSYHAADLCLVSAYVKSRFSHDAAQMVSKITQKSILFHVLCVVHVEII